MERTFLLTQGFDFNGERISLQVEPETANDYEAVFMATYLIEPALQKVKSRQHTIEDDLVKTLTKLSTRYQFYFTSDIEETNDSTEYDKVYRFTIDGGKYPTDNLEAVSFLKDSVDELMTVLDDTFRKTEQGKGKQANIRARRKARQLKADIDTFCKISKGV